MSTASETHMLGKKLAVLGGRCLRVSDRGRQSKSSLTTAPTTKGQPFIAINTSFGHDL